jgi:hypothetical protein
LDRWGTETTTASPKHPLVTPHPGGTTQGTPGQVPDHFIHPSLSPPDTRFCAPPLRRMRHGPHWTSSGTAGERPLPAAPASILSQVLSQPIWDGSATAPGRARPQLSLKDPSRPRLAGAFTEITTTAPKHLLGAPHQVGPTQGIPGHVPNHFIRPSLSHPRTRFCAPHASMWCLYVQVSACIHRYM